MFWVEWGMFWWILVSFIDVSLLWHFNAFIYSYPTIPHHTRVRCPMSTMFLISAMWLDACSALMSMPGRVTMFIWTVSEFDNLLTIPYHTYPAGTHLSAAFLASVVITSSTSAALMSTVQQQKQRFVVVKILLLAFTYWSLKFIISIIWSLNYTHIHILTFTH